MLYLCYWVIISAGSYILLQAFGAIDTGRRAYTNPGLEFIVYTAVMTWACAVTKHPHEWLNLLVAVYAVTCAETDYKEQVVFRILHYPVIAASMYAYMINPIMPKEFGYQFGVTPVMYLVLLFLAQRLRAYKAGDTWMFLAAGLYLHAHGFNDMQLLLFWFIAIGLFVIRNVMSIKLIKSKESGRKMLVLSKAKPIGPYIMLSLALCMAHQFY